MSWIKGSEFKSLLDHAIFCGAVMWHNAGIIVATRYQDALHAHSAKLASIVTNVLSSVCVCWSQLWALRKQLNQLRCPLGCAREWVKKCVKWECERGNFKENTCKPTVESVNSPTYLTCKMASLSHVRTALCVVVLMVYRVWISLLRKHALHVKLYATSINYKHLNRKVFHTAYVKCSTLTSRG